MVDRTRSRKRTEITFVLPVGRPDGSRAATIAFPVNQRHGFRYLADGGHWLDEDEADGHDGRTCLLHT
ncbi:hypothetical protein ACIQV3_34515 [Streptomyces sp. NPDC099050]|uniref:hypothetical protein n=1 Tax=Streptomyces sp. NPDC099050 TaxID=3366100 RepID=UPI0037F52308